VPDVALDRSTADAEKRPEARVARQRSHATRSSRQRWRSTSITASSCEVGVAHCSKSVLKMVDGKA